MNRSQKRKFSKVARGRGVKQSVIDLYLAMDGKLLPIQDLKEGDIVKLNIENIKKHPDYPKLTHMYRQFVENNADSLFTVTYDESKRGTNIVRLKEDPAGWLFYSGDLIKVEPERG